jgi:phosphatidylglycerol:prolipoprotein diacylglycerol transferase
MIPWFTSPSLPIGPLTIHTFGVLVATGILVGANLTQRRGKQLGLKPEPISQMITTVLICGFLMAHWVAVFAYHTGGELTLLKILNPLEGISSFGGFLGAVLGLYGWCRVKKQPIMPYADSLAYGLAAGWLFGRLGCFSAHDHPGRLTHFFLSVNYQAFRPSLNGPRHDLGLDEAIWALFMTGLFLFLGRRKRPLGLYVTLLSLCYAPVRFFLDSLRATDIENADARYFGLTPAQYGAIACLGAGVALLVWMLRRRAALSAETAAD